MMPKSQTLQRAHRFFLTVQPEWWNSGWAAVHAEWNCHVHQHEEAIVECNKKMMLIRTLLRKENAVIMVKATLVFVKIGNRISIQSD